jgi:hypothetical protein
MLVDTASASGALGLALKMARIEDRYTLKWICRGGASNVENIQWTPVRTW